MILHNFTSATRQHQLASVDHDVGKLPLKSRIRITNAHEVAPRKAVRGDIKREVPRLHGLLHKLDRDLLQAAHIKGNSLHIGKRGDVPRHDSQPRVLRKHKISQLCQPTNDHWKALKVICRTIQNEQVGTCFQGLWQVGKVIIVEMQDLKMVP